jgi:hypothetical protein
MQTMVEKATTRKILKPSQYYVLVLATTLPSLKRQPGIARVW